MKREHWLALFLSAGTIPCHADERPVPTYTDADLDRIHPRRAETGVLSNPAFRPEPASRERAADAHGETYWRREAEKLSVQLRPLRREAETLRSRIKNAAARPPASASMTQRSPGKRQTRPSSQPSAPDTRALEDRLRGVEAELRERQDELEERARKEGALPGWIR